MDEDPYGSADPAPLPAGAELGPEGWICNVAPQRSRSGCS